MARQFVYFMKGLTKSYPTRKVLDNVHLSFYPDAKIGVLGVNGSGKSTLLRIMAGLDKEYNGEAWVAEGARVGYLEQEPHLDETKTVRENVMLGVAKQKAILDRYNELAMNYSEETADEMTKLQDEIEAAGLWDLDSKVDQAMDALRCPPDDADVTKLSGGERRRVALCKLLLDQPDLLLLDEPTNHLDAESVSWLEGHLRNYPGAILIVTHDRYFLDNVTSWILELDRGKGIPYEGNYSSWLVQKQKRLEQEGREDAAHQKTLEREQEWIASSPKARQAKSKARYQRYEDLLKQASEKQTQTAQITIPVAERLGQNVVDFEGLSKGFGDRMLIDDLTFKLPPGGIVGVIGPNGAGKTTLFRMITKAGDAGQGHHHRRRKRASRLRRPVARRSRRQEDRSGRKFPAATNSSCSASARSIRAAIARRSTSRAPTSRRRSARCRAVSATACIWPRCSSPAPTCCCSTNRPTISTSTRCARWKRRWRISPAAPSSSAMTAGSSTASPPTSWPSKATAMSNGSRATSRTTRRTRCAGSARTPSSRIA